jgi:hypothetical protein
MNTRQRTVTCIWDDDARVWYVAESDIPGLATEAATFEDMERKLITMIPELLSLNETVPPLDRVPFELITRKQESAAV